MIFLACVLLMLFVMGMSVGFAAWFRADRNHAERLLLDEQRRRMEAEAFIDDMQRRGVFEDREALLARLDAWGS